MLDQYPQCRHTRLAHVPDDPFADMWQDLGKTVGRDAPFAANVLAVLRVLADKGFDAGRDYPEALGAVVLDDLLYHISSGSPCDCTLVLTLSKALVRYMTRKASPRSFRTSI